MKNRQSGDDGPNVPKKPGDISKEPAMIELKKLFATLSPDRQDALLDQLKKQSNK